MVEECGLLGHVISEEDVSVDSKKIEAVVDWPQPTNIIEVRRFLGLVGYFWKFIKRFSTIVTPLNKLTQSEQNLSW